MRRSREQSRQRSCRGWFETRSRRRRRQCETCDHGGRGGAPRTLGGVRGRGARAAGAPETWEKEWADVSADIGGRGGVWIAEDDEGVAGSVRAKMIEANVWHIASAYVRPRARKQGVLRALMREAVDEGEGARLDPRHPRRAEARTSRPSRPGASSASSRSRLRWRLSSTRFWSVANGLRRAGRPTSRPTSATPSSARSPSTCRGSGAPLRPRSPSRRTAGHASTTSSAATSPPPFADSAASCRWRSDNIVLTLGIEESAVVRYILWDHGGIADEYASVPEHWGPIPPGDVVALGANPTVAQRLTGADPDRCAPSPAPQPLSDELRRRSELPSLSWPRSRSG